MKASVQVALASLALLPGTAWADQVQGVASPAQVTPDRIEPQIEQHEDAVVLPQTISNVAPEGAEKLSVRVGKVEVVGAGPDMVAAIAAITTPLDGQTITVARLYQAAAEIEALYARSGKILTRAVIPAQDLRDGATCRIEIVDGFIESVDASAVPATVRKAVEARAARLIGRHGLTMSQIERRLLLATQVPGVSLQSTLVPGSKPGGAVLVLKSEWQPVHFALGTDNSLSDAYDNWSVDAQISLNSVLGLGEQIYGFASSTTDFDLFGGKPRRRILAAGATVPLGTDGLTVNAEYIRADINPKATAGGVAVQGQLDHAALRISYPAQLTRRESLNLVAAFDLLDESQDASAFSTRLSDDRLRYFTLGFNWSKAGAHGLLTSMGLSFSQGIDGLGARDQADADQTGVLLSRQGSRPDFSRVNGNASLRFSPAGAVAFSLLARGQVSLNGALPGAAQFSLDSPLGLSGFALGSINVDSGATLRAEVARPIRLRSAAFQPYLFAAWGAGSLSQPTVLEKADVSGWSAGGGLRANLSDTIHAEAELARSHANIFTADDTRLTVRIRLQF